MLKYYKWVIILAKNRIFQLLQLNRSVYFYRRIIHFFKFCTKTLYFILEWYILIWNRGWVIILINRWILFERIQFLPSLLKCWLKLLCFLGFFFLNLLKFIYLLLKKIILISKWEHFVFKFRFWLFIFEITVIFVLCRVFI